MFSIKNDVEAFLESEAMTEMEFARVLGITRPTLSVAINQNVFSQKTLEKIFSYIYGRGYRLNQARADLLAESRKYGERLLFHGAKEPIESIRPDGSRADCDFGSGFYLGEYYASSASFVLRYPSSCVYAFVLRERGLRTLEYSCDLPWMLSICYHRGYLRPYEAHPKLLDLLAKEEVADCIVAPIADNKMFQILREFALGEISATMAMHALSASYLGNQYVLKTAKAIDHLFLEAQMFLSAPERADLEQRGQERALLIDSKLKLAKRTFRDDGGFIEDIFHD